ncbi:uncharacterized protein LOC103789163 isoform X2 [Callithrix jacchus]
MEQNADGLGDLHSALGPSLFQCSRGKCAFERRLWARKGGGMYANSSAVGERRFWQKQKRFLTSFAFCSYFINFRRKGIKVMVNQAPFISGF